LVLYPCCQEEDREFVNRLIYIEIVEHCEI
jgi:hypothetical protein